jgi:hypothetical protein
LCISGKSFGYDFARSIVESTWRLSVSESSGSRWRSLFIVGGSSEAVSPGVAVVGEATTVVATSTLELAVSGVGGCCESDELGASLDKDVAAVEAGGPAASDPAVVTGSEEFPAVEGLALPLPLTKFDAPITGDAVELAEADADMVGTGKTVQVEMSISVIA